MNRGRWLIVSALLAMAGQSAVPARAEVVWFGPAMVSWEAYADAKMCFFFDLQFVAGAATATGLVKTRPAETIVLNQRMASPLNTLVADYRPLASTRAYEKVCVGGTGVPAVGGTVVFSITLHTLYGDYVTVIRCTYRPDGFAC